MNENEQLLLDGRRYQYLRLLATCSDANIIGLFFEHPKNDEWDQSQNVSDDFDFSVDEQIKVFDSLIKDSILVKIKTNLINQYCKNDT